MQVSTIRTHIDEFEKAYPSLNTKSYLYYYLFKASPSTQDIHHKIATTLKSEETNRLWKKERYQPKDHFLKIWADQTEALSLAWGDLQNTKLPLEKRVDKFQFHQDLALQTYNQNRLSDRIGDDQVDAQFISLLLSMEQPQSYCVYHSKIFFAFAKAVKAYPAPVIDDLIRYQKMTEIYFKFLKERKSIISTFQTRYGIPVLPKNIVVECLAYNLELDILE